MRSWRRFFLITALVLLGIAGAGTAVALSDWRPWRDQPEYAAVPFNRVSADFPRIIPVKERESTKEITAIRKFLTETGAIRHATPEEQAALKEVDEKNYVKAGELAQTILQSHPDSVPARLVTAQVHHYAESNLPRALFEIRAARHVLEKGQLDREDPDGQEWYLRVLEEEYYILASMDRREEQLQVIDLLEQVYQPLPWLRVFPLIKLGRLDEARAVLRHMEEDGNWPRHSLNSRCMVEEQARNRTGCCEAARDMVTKYKDSAVLWYNYGLSCLNDFRLPEAEKAFVKSATGVRCDFYGSPYLRLGMFYLQQGRIPEAWHAIKQGQAQRWSRQPYTLEQDQSFADRSIALMLLALGRGEDAERFARRAYERPGRTGFTTDDERTELLLNGLVFWQVLQTRMEEMREADSQQSLVDRLKPNTRLESMELEAWTLKRHLLTLLSDEKFLQELLRPYMPGQDDKEAWFTPTILQLLPPGVAVEALRQAREAEDLAKYPAAAAYFDALAAELALSRGEPREALQLARQALDSLPAQGERLLRARVAAVGAEAAHQLGLGEESLTLADQALRDFPQVFRILKIAIPVHVEDDGSPLARELTRCLFLSPCFREDPAGFAITVQSTSDGLTFSLTRQGGANHFEASVPLGDSDSQVVASAVRRFHERLMSPLLDLTEVDVNALDISASDKKANAANDGLLNK
jgi:tetratricopeptide (TPR) repeat protein